MQWFNCKVDERSKVVGGDQRFEKPDEYVFPLSWNLVWFACTPSRLLLMVTFRNTPMSSSHILTLGMCLFWTMVVDLPFLRKFTKKMMIPCSQILCLMNLGIFTSEWYNTWTFSGIQALQRLGSILSMLIFTSTILSRSDLILIGNLNRLSKIPTRLPQGFEELSPNMISSRSISRLGIQVLTFPGGMNLLLLIQSLVTHLPSMIKVAWPSSLLERTH